MTDRLSQPYSIEVPVGTEPDLARQLEQIQRNFESLFQQNVISDVLLAGDLEALLAALDNGFLTNVGGSFVVITNPLPVGSGGTGLGTFVAGDVLYASAVTTVAGLAIGAAGKIIRSTGTVPAYSTFTIPNTFTAGDLPHASATNTITALTVGSAGQIVRSTGTLPAYSTFTIPNTFAQGDVVFGSATNILTALVKDANATRYLSNTGTSNNPAWAQVALATGVSGDLPLANLTPSANATRVLGRTDASAGDWQELSLGAGLGISGTVLSNTSLAANHVLLDGSVHSDTIAQTVSRGSLVYGNGTPKWDELTVGAVRNILTANGTDVAWSATPTVTQLFTTGNVGVVQGVPLRLLHVGAGADTPANGAQGVYISNAGETALIIRDSNADVEFTVNVDVTGALIGTLTNHALHFYSGTEKVTLLNSGFLGVGNTTPLKLLHVGAGADTPADGTQGIYVSNNGGTAIVVRDSTNNVEFAVDVDSTGALFGMLTAHPLNLYANGAQRLTLNATALTSTLPYYAPVGSASAPAYTHTSDTNTGIYFDGADSIFISSGGTERVRVNSGGRLQITTAGDATAPQYSKSDDDDTGPFFPAANTYAIGTGGAEQVRITSTGVGIGMTAAQKLDVLGNVKLGAASGAAGSRIIGRGEATSAPAGTLATGEWELALYDNGATPVLRVRYNDAGSTKTFDVGPLV